MTHAEHQQTTSVEADHTASHITAGQYAVAEAAVLAPEIATTYQMCPKAF